MVHDNFYRLLFSILKNHNIHKDIFLYIIRFRSSFETIWEWKTLWRASKLTGIVGVGDKNQPQHYGKEGNHCVLTVKHDPCISNLWHMDSVYLCIVCSNFIRHQMKSNGYKRLEYKMNIFVVGYKRWIHLLEWQDDIGDVPNSL